MRVYYAEIATKTSAHLGVKCTHISKTTNVCQGIGQCHAQTTTHIVVHYVAKRILLVYNWIMIVALVTEIGCESYREIKLYY